MEKVRLVYTNRVQYFMDQMRKSKAEYEFVPVCFGCGKRTGEEDLTDDLELFKCKSCNEKEIYRTIRRSSLNGD